MVTLLVLALSICVAPAASTSTSTGATNPLVIPSAEQQFLEAHNKARTAAGVGPLKWSEELANAADLIARQFDNQWSCPTVDTIDLTYGETHMSNVAGMTPQMVVNRWVGEKNYYNYANNSCAPSHDCGLYKQVVWKHTSELGCAQALCMMDTTTFTLCFYNPPGNLVGERPY